MGDQFVRPVERIWTGYKEILATPRSSRERPLRELLAQQFGIMSWEWQRLMTIFKAHEAGDKIASGLLAAINGRKLTLSTAYSRLLQHQETRSVDPRRRFPLQSLHVRALEMAEYAEAIAKDLRNGMALNTSGMSDNDTSDCIAQLRRISLRMSQAADCLQRSVRGQVPPR